MLHQGVVCIVVENTGFRMGTAVLLTTGSCVGLQLAVVPTPGKEWQYNEEIRKK